MSLAIISGKVSSITNGSEIGNFASRALFGNSSFLRNDERGVDRVAGAISSIQNILTDLSHAAGLKNNMYVIGRADYTDITNNRFSVMSAYYPNAITRSIAKNASRAVSYWRGGEWTDLWQNGVIIDGFDNFRGDISVALPDNPVVYGTSTVDQVVRNPNRITMRVYVDLVHSDDVVQNIMQSVANSFAGVGGTIMKAISGEQMNRVQKALSGLQWIQENGRPFKVYTPHKVYDNMMIEKIAPINDQKMNEILAADITFKEIIPIQSLGNKNKTTARIPPSNSSRQLASTAGWLSF